MFKKLKKNLANRKRAVILAVAVIILIFAGVKILANKKAATPQYQTATVEKGNLVATVSASGQIIQANIINITTQATGVVKEVLVKDGDKVYSGQPLAKLELDPAGTLAEAQAYSAYLSAKNSLSSAQTNLYTLQNSLFVANQKFINDAAARGLATNDPTYIEEWASWLAAEATYKNQENVIALAKINLNSAWLSYQQASATIFAPLAGTIDNITLTPGQVISTTGRVAVIKTQGNPIGTFNVSEIDIIKVKPGQKATVTLDSIADKTFTGMVTTVDKIGTVSSGVTNYPVSISFDTESEQVLPNMSASANIIITSKDNVLLVPSSAIQTQNNQNVVRILGKNKEVQYVNVEIGISSDTQTEIISGISEGETVISGTVSTTTSSQSSSVFSSFGRGAGGGTVRIPRD